ncbi:putative membrane protein [Pseudoalteromonas luteoviolacea B = ATCC 29581]|nr:putative membrane protein [Pseudoalteromonas luteoviolacea B = ATCC 29581]
MSKGIRVVALYLLSMSVMCIGFFHAYHQRSHEAHRQALNEVKVRVALDIDNLGVAQPFFKNAGNEWQLNQYLSALNHQLVEHNAPFVVEHIKALEQAITPNEQQVVLKKSFGNVLLEFKPKSRFPWHGLIVPVLLGVLVASFWLRFLRKAKKRATTKTTEDGLALASPNLIIDLYQKTLQVGENGEKVSLANKPLCFYLALLEYSNTESDAVLNTNKQLPDAFLELADKYFHRLVSLGHTIRKRPNFNNSLEKTLSEIRASLDEAFSDHPDLKSDYYPPKAHGEGSRSKLHSFMPTGFDFSHIVIHGK